MMGQRVPVTYEELLCVSKKLAQVISAFARRAGPSVGSDQHYVNRQRRHTKYLVEDV